MRVDRGVAGELSHGTCKIGAVDIPTETNARRVHRRLYAKRILWTEGRTTLVFIESSTGVIDSHETSAARKWRDVSEKCWKSFHWSIDAFRIKCFFGHRPSLSLLREWMHANAHVTCRTVVKAIHTMLTQLNIDIFFSFSFLFLRRPKRAIIADLCASIASASELLANSIHILMRRNCVIPCAMHVDTSFVVITIRVRISCKRLAFQSYAPSTPAYEVHFALTRIPLLLAHTHTGMTLAKQWKCYLSLNQHRYHRQWWHRQKGFDARAKEKGAGTLHDYVRVVWYVRSTQPKTNILELFVMMWMPTKCRKSRKK